MENGNEAIDGVFYVAFGSGVQWLWFEMHALLLDFEDDWQVAGKREHVEP